MAIFFILFLIVACLFILAIPVLLAYSFYNWLNKKGYKEIGVCILIALIAFEVYSVYTAIFPTDSFYKEEFEECFKIKFPKSGEIIAKDASYPDIHGDYDAAFVATLNDKDYNNLLVSFKKDSLNRQAGDISFSMESYNNLKMKINASVPLYAFDREEEFGNRSSIGFMKNHTIIFLHVNY